MALRRSYRKEVTVVGKTKTDKKTSKGKPNKKKGK